MVGRIEKFPPCTIFQTLDVNNKIGENWILTLTQLQEGETRFSMRQAALLKTSYSGSNGVAVLYQVLRKKQARYKLPPELPSEDFETL